MFISCSECPASELADKPDAYTGKGCLRDCASIPCILYVRMLYPPPRVIRTRIAAATVDVVAYCF